MNRRSLLQGFLIGASGLLVPEKRFWSLGALPNTEKIRLPWSAAMFADFVQCTRPTPYKSFEAVAQELRVNRKARLHIERCADRGLSASSRFHLFKAARSELSP